MALASLLESYRIIGNNQNGAPIETGGVWMSAKAEMEN